VDEALLGLSTERLVAELAEPLNTTVVQNQHAMTTALREADMFHRVCLDDFRTLELQLHQRGQG
jgi:hypothetical protein